MQRRHVRRSPEPRIVLDVFPDEPEMEQREIVDQLTDEALFSRSERLIPADKTALLELFEITSQSSGLTQGTVGRELLAGQSNLLRAKGIDDLYVRFRVLEERGIELRKLKPQFRIRRKKQRIHILRQTQSWLQEAPI